MERVLRALDADPGLLDTAERDVSPDHERVVDADHTNFHLLGDAPDLADVLREEIAGETAAGVIGDGYRFFLRFKPAKWYKNKREKYG